MKTRGYGKGACGSRARVGVCVLVGLAALLTSDAGGPLSAIAVAGEGGDEAAMDANRVRVKNGLVLPKRPVGEALREAMSFLRKSDGDYVPGQGGQGLAGYFLSAKVHADGTAVGPEVTYPARHHAYFILTFLRYYAYSGENEWRLRARDLADWNIAHSTGADAAYPYLPYSTYTWDGPPRGPDRNGIEPDKAAFLGSAYLALFDTTGQEKYRTAAVRIADTLVKTQCANGSWSFRVVPADGTVIEDFGGAPVLAVEFFERMIARQDTPAYRAAYDKALAWMLRTNVERNEWGTYHEDVAPVDKTYSAAEQTCFTAAWLFRHAGRHPEYQAGGMQVLKHIDGRFVHHEGHPMSPAPAVAEQPGCNHIMPGHTARYCSVLADLYALTGDEAYKRLVLSGLAGTTYMQADDGIFRTWIWHMDSKKQQGGLDWYSQHLYTVYHTLEIIARLPELAPDREDHLLNSTAGVRVIAYDKGRVTFETAAPSTTLLKLSFTPKSLQVAGRHLKALDGLDEATDGWSFDPKTGVCRVRHGTGTVEISDGLPTTGIEN